MTKAKKKSAYAQAGVDIDEMMQGLDAIKKMVKGTDTPGVLSSIGSFGGLFQSPGRDQVLVASTDGVGTKLNVAMKAGRHHTVGQDLVNHCTNDILVQGATPLFFLDYLGTSNLSAAMFKDVISGLCKACRENGCALLGGETAEMPGVYREGEFDLAGTIVGRVLPEHVIDGSGMRAGDAVWGLPSTGLHTNGYSLARKVLLERAALQVGDAPPELEGQTIGDALLAVHRSYLTGMRAVWDTCGRDAVRGLIHITGGGFYDNIPRVVPDGLCVHVDPTTWTPLPIFRLIQSLGDIADTEMYRVFNMGIGLVVVTPSDCDLGLIPGLDAVRIGEVRAGKTRVHLPW